MITVHVCAHTHPHRHRHIHTPDSTDKLGQRRKPAWSRHRSERHVRPGHPMAEPTSMMDVWVGSAEFWKLSGVCKRAGRCTFGEGFGGGLPLFLLDWGGKQLLGRGWCSAGAGGQRVRILPLGGMLQDLEPLLFSLARKDSMERYGSKGIIPSGWNSS